MKDVLNFFKRKSTVIFGIYVELEDRYEKELNDVLNGNYDAKQLGKYRLLIDQTINVQRENSIFSLLSLLELTLKHAYCDRDMTVKKCADKMRGQCDDSILDTLVNMYDLRNCISHDSGKVQGSKKEAKIRQVVADLNERYKENNFDLAGITKDGYLLLGSDIVSHLLVTIEELLGMLLNTNL